MHQSKNQLINTKKIIIKGSLLLWSVVSLQLYSSSLTRTSFGSFYSFESL